LVTDYIWATNEILIFREME